MTNPTRVKLYVNAEDVDGYHRDGCVFGEDIDIYDSMSAVVSYSNGATMTYSVNAFMPFEGHRLAFNGEKGRLEIRDYERQPWEQTEETEIQLTKNFGKMQKVPIKQETTGGHGGGDTTPRSDLPEVRRARAHAAARLARRRDVLSDRHRRAHERRREAPVKIPSSSRSSS